MKISEIFYSIQGEGRLAGVPSVFVRLAGCPLRCRWCDTQYAWDYKNARKLSVAGILAKVNQYPAEHVVITGGEPMLLPDLKVNKELMELTTGLRQIGRHITIETAGLVYIPDLPCDLMSISPKLSNAIPKTEKLAQIHRRAPRDAAVIAELIDHYECQLKFVVESPADMDEIHDVLKQVPVIEKSRIMLMPQASTRVELIDRSPIVAQCCKETGFSFCNRLQVLIWDNQRGV